MDQEWAQGRASSPPSVKRSPRAEVRVTTAAASGIRPHIDEFDVPQRAWLDGSTLKVNALDPSVKAYLGPKGDGWPGQETVHFNAMLAEVLASTVVRHKLQSKYGEPYDVVRLFGEYQSRTREVAATGTQRPRPSRRAAWRCAVAVITRRASLPAEALLDSLRRRSVAQLEEQRSPKPQVGGSNPSTPARYTRRGGGIGRHAVLEGAVPVRAYEFESHPRHQQSHHAAPRELGRACA